MDNKTLITKGLPQFSSTFKSELITYGSVQKIPANTLVIRAGQYLNGIPIVLEGIIKVSTNNDEKELLLYYIKPKESCIMSFQSCLQQFPSQISALTETESTVLLLPAEKVISWSVDFPELHRLFFQQYHQRYSDMLDTIQQLVFEKLDLRIYIFLQEKCKALQQNPLLISHKQIALEIGTAREVVSRILKKLEHEKKISQEKNSIKLL